MFPSPKDFVEILFTSVLLLVLVLVISYAIVGIVKADEGDICTSDSYCSCEDPSQTPMCIRNPVGTIGHCVCL
jgi:hypothetical protein